MASLTAVSHLMQINVQLEDLRAKLNEPPVPLSNELLLTYSTQLQPLYKKLLITNLDDSLARQLEIAMWNDCFKTPLTRFGRTDKNLFYLMIESGVGFYLGLIQDIGIHFDISFITSATAANKLFCTKTSQSPLVSPSKASVYYIIQNCLLHVGDLLRYQGSFPEAIKMYDKSAAVYPSSGHPYHQMGVTQLLITAPDDYAAMNNFVTAFYYHARALAVPNPHLQSYAVFEPITQRILNMPVGSSKYQESLRQFLLIISAVLRKDQMSSALAGNIVPMLSPLVANEQIKPSILFQMICISVWTHWRIMGTEGNGGGDVVQSEETVLDIIVALLNSIVKAASSLFGEQASWNFISNLTDRQFATSVHLKLLMDWLSRLYQNEKTVKQVRLIREKVNMGKLVKVLNLMKATIGETDDTDVNNHGGTPSCILPEEKRLIGFLPLDYSHLRTSGAILLHETNPKTQTYRINRLIQSAINLSHPHSSSFTNNFSYTSDSNTFTFIAYDGNEFGEPLISGLSPVLLPNRRNVALTSIFRSGLATSRGGNLSSSSIPSFEFGDGNSSFGSYGAVSPTNSNASLSPMNSVTSLSLYGAGLQSSVKGKSGSTASASPTIDNLAAQSTTTAASFLSPPDSNNLSSNKDPFRSIWTPDSSSKSVNTTKIDPALWN